MHDMIIEITTRTAKKVERLLKTQPDSVEQRDCNLRGFHEHAGTMMRWEIRGWYPTPKSKRSNIQIQKICDYCWLPFLRSKRNGEGLIKLSNI